MRGSSKVRLFSNTTEEVLGFSNLCRVWEASGFWSVDSVREALGATGTNITYIAENERNDSWCAGCMFRHAGEIAELLYIYVLPKFRRQGLADHLFDDMVTRLRKQDCSRLLLEVRPENHSAIELYKSFGMRQIALRKRYYQNGDDALILQLDLK